MKPRLLPFRACSSDETTSYHMLDCILGNWDPSKYLLQNQMFQCASNSMYFQVLLWTEVVGIHVPSIIYSRPLRTLESTLLGRWLGHIFPSGSRIETLLLQVALNPRRPEQFLDSSFAQEWAFCISNSDCLRCKQWLDKYVQLNHLFLIGPVLQQAFSPVPQAFSLAPQW